ncbi:TPA: proline--tRNA ligase [Candidatus Woesearchaeota archaeon]|nr:proline--tRNA ligase [Candidatus Woesearchaeota archaeon]
MEKSGQRQKKQAKQEDKDTLGLTVKKSEDFSEWYSQLVIKSGLADYSAVSGCMVIRPLGMSLWDNIRAACEPRLKGMGVQNCYFPLFIPESLLKKEAAHVEGFTPECAWVTHGGNTPLGEKLAVRPTSEAIMYDSYSRWVRSWRDLPLKLMQWNNVVRWEFKHPTLLMRTREFLWVEGHTAFATRDEAEQEIRDITELWKDVCGNTLALHGIHGRKTEKEKFAGAEYTESLEFFVPNGRMAQGPDAHADGQNFARAYGITFLDQKGNTSMAFQNTWAITTRMLGVLVAVHGDDKGLVIPPRLAPNKAVIVPIIFEDSRKEVLAACAKLRKDLAEFSPLLDDRDEYSPGWKFNEWELKGIPVRVELGPRDLKAGHAVLVRRDTGEKKTVPLADAQRAVKGMLDAMQKDMLARSRKMTEEAVVEVSSTAELAKAVGDKKVGRGPFCNTPACEDAIKEKSDGASSRGIVGKKKGPCIECGRPATALTLFGKSY